MKVERYEIVKAIARSNGVVLKDRNFPILGCILLADGSAIASNTEITIEQKLGTQEGEGEIVLPMRAFDMIKNLPDGAIDITQDESYRVTIRQGKVKSSFASYPPQDFTLRKDRPIGDGTVLPGERLMAALSKVIFAVDDQSSKMPLRGVHIKASGMTLTVEATDGHILARDQIKLDLMTHIDVIIPKMTVKKIISMDTADDVRIIYDNTSCVFETDGYTIYSRLIDGQYADLDRIFRMEDKGSAMKIKGKELEAALTRATIANDSSDRQALVMNVESCAVSFRLVSAMADYDEDLNLNECMMADFEVAMNPKIFLEATRGYGDREVCVSATGERAPIFLSSDGEELRMILLPVMVGVEKKSA